MIVDPENSSQHHLLKNIYQGLDLTEEIAKLTTHTETSDQLNDEKRKSKAEVGKKFLAREFHCSYCSDKKMFSF